MAWVPTWTDHSPIQQRDLRSDLSSIARLVGMPPRFVLLTPAALRQTFLSRTAAAYGISTGRWRNILSSLRYVLRRAGVIDEIDTPVSEAWAALLERLEIPKRAAVIGFARFCSLLGIEPSDVSTEVLQAFETQVIERTLTTRPKKRIGSLRSFWNLCSTKVPGWPATRLEGGRSHDYIRSLEVFRPEFRDDLERFGNRLTASAFDADEAFRGGPDVDGAAAKEDFSEQEMPPDRGKPVQLITRDLRLSHARWAASAAVASRILPVSAIGCVRDLVTPSSRPKAILKFLYDRAGKKPSAAGMHVADVLRIIARHDARLPKKEVAQIVRWGSAVRLRYDGMTEKNERIVRMASSPAADARLLALPDTLLLNANKLFESSPKAAVSQALRATVLELIGKTPLRSKEIRHLRLDQHLQRPDPRRSLIGHISIPAAERKAPVPYAVSVSKETADILELWIQKFRPIIAPANCQYLFPSFTGEDRPITRQGLREALVKVTAQYVGVGITPHAHRHLAGHHYLEAHPGHYGAVSRLLGHKDMATAQRFYVSKENEAAHKKYDEVVLKRKELLPVGSKRSRPKKGSQ